MFFELLRKSGTKRIVDVRLNNVSQLAGFSKRDDLRYFLKEIVGIDYIHLPLLAPTQDILDAYKKHKGDWNAYEAAFLELMKNARSKSGSIPKPSKALACCAARTNLTTATAVSSPNTSELTGES